MPIPEGEYTVPPMGRYRAWRASGFHKGVDQYGDEGTESVLMADAAILRVRYNGDTKNGFGHSVAYQHLHDGAEVIEAHFMSKPPVTAGRVYKRGTIIGLRGDTGNAIRVGPHVHVEVRLKNGKLTDPTPYFRKLNPDPEEDTVKLIRRSEGSPEWSFFNPSFAGPTEIERGYFVVKDEAIARGLARTWGLGFGREKAEPRDVYVEEQAAARETFAAYQRGLALSGTGGSSDMNLEPVLTKLDDIAEDVNKPWQVTR